MWSPGEIEVNQCCFLACLFGNVLLSFSILRLQNHECTVWFRIASSSGWTDALVLDFRNRPASKGGRIYRPKKLKRFHQPRNSQLCSTLTMRTQKKVLCNKGWLCWLWFFAWAAVTLHVFRRGGGGGFTVEPSSCWWCPPSHPCWGYEVNVKLQLCNVTSSANIRKISSKGDSVSTDVKNTLWCMFFFFFRNSTLWNNDVVFWVFGLELM